MTAVNWNDLFESNHYFELLQGEERGRANEASSHYIAQLAIGVSGIGNLLACTASNGVTGLSDEAATDVGWMLKAVGDLINRLNDIAVATMPDGREMESAS